MMSISIASWEILAFIIAESIAIIALICKIGKLRKEQQITQKFLGELLKLDATSLKAAVAIFRATTLNKHSNNEPRG